MRSHMLLSAMMALAGCDYSGTDLYAKATDVPGVIDLGKIEPADIFSAADFPEAILYDEVGATGNSQLGGVTVSFTSTGSSVCLWVDPELVFWNESVAVVDPTDEFAFADNVQDDGDIDLYAGYAVYYSGSPGEEVGNFQIRYQDALGNVVPIDLNECTIASGQAATGGHSGRGRPEYCTLRATQPGVDYLVLLQTWSTPIDDDKLSYGLVVSQGTCAELKQKVAPGIDDECVITGEALDPETGETIPGSKEFEQAFCAATTGDTTLADYCADERAHRAACVVDPSGAGCGSRRYFCGDE